MEAEVSTILKLLEDKGYPLSLKEIMEGVELPRPRVNKSLTYLIKENRIKKGTNAEQIPQFSLVQSQGVNPSDEGSVATPDSSSREGAKDIQHIMDFLRTPRTEDALIGIGASMDLLRDLEEQKLVQSDRLMNQIVFHLTKEGEDQLAQPDEGGVEPRCLVPESNGLDHRRSSVDLYATLPG